MLECYMVCKYTALTARSHKNHLIHNDHIIHDDRNAHNGVSGHSHCHNNLA